jgi:hypothetical protein
MTQSIFKEGHHCVFRVVYEYMLFACCIFCGCDSRGCPKRPKDLMKDMILACEAALGFKTQ